MPKLQNRRQINVQVWDDMFDDIHLVACRRGQSISEFIRRAIDKELEEDSICSVTE